MGFHHGKLAIHGRGRPRQRSVGALSRRQPPARLLAMIALHIAISGSALIGFPWWKARVRAVLFWWPRVMIPTGCLAEVGNTGYTLAMAKVMISLPDGLLARLDASARERGPGTGVASSGSMGVGERSSDSLGLNGNRPPKDRCRR